MKTVILAGGFGSRLGEESILRPKPMVEIGAKPLLWHILKIYSSQGFNEFIICLGYKGYVIKEYFANFVLHESDVTIDLSKKGALEYHSHTKEKWRVTLVETGLETMTASRIRKIRSYIGQDRFMLTYGDGVADVSLKKLIDFHNASGKVGTVTAVQPAGRFGTLALTDNCSVSAFQEKPVSGSGWINAGFFVFENKIFEYLDEDRDDQVFEGGPLERLSHDGQLSAYKHTGFWQPVDTVRDRQLLEKLWLEGQAPWKVW